MCIDAALVDPPFPDGKPTATPLLYFYGSQPAALPAAFAVFALIQLAGSIGILVGMETQEMTLEEICKEP